MALETFGNRKELALTSERAVRRDALRIVRGLGSKADFLPVEPDAAQRQRTQAVSPSASKKWT